MSGPSSGAQADPGGAAEESDPGDPVPGSGDRDSGEAVVADADSGGPVAAEPDPGDPVASEPDPGDPVVADPGPGDPVAAEPGPGDPDEPSVWAATMATLAAAGDRLTAELRARGEDADTADAYVTMLGALMDAHLNRVSADVDHPTFVPCAGWFQHTGSPNPDTVYRRAPVDPAGTYALTGERGTAADVTIMPFEEPSMRGLAPFDLSDVARGPDGRFEVVLSAERPPSGDWWRLEPEVRSLWLRTVSDRWGEDREPRIAIRRVDGVPRARVPTRRMARRLAVLGPMVERIVEYGLRHADELADAGIVNDVRLVDYGTQGAMPGQWYHEGLFDLPDDSSVLLVEATMPAGWDYVSWSLTDRMLVTLDWVHAQTSLNRTQATVDPDGVLRVVVSRRDPGVRNWMDTLGHRHGVLQCRTGGSDAPPTFSTRVVPLAALDRELPASTAWVTPAERAQALVVRTTGAQMRSLW